MSGPLGDLLALQDIDLALDQHRHRRSHLPERAELEATEAELVRCRVELEALGAELAELEKLQSSVEAELAATETRSAAIDRRLYGGDVSASKDLQAMSAELAQLRSRASTLEDGVLEILEAREPLDARSEALEATMAQLGARRDDLAARVADAEATLDAETGELQDRRREAASLVDAALLAIYERLRGRLGGVGVARLVGNHCDGCHLTLSAMELERVRHLPDGEVYTCEQCSRILVP